MKKLLLLFFLLPVIAKGQIYSGPVLDSAAFTFSTGDDSLIRYVHGFGPDSAKVFIDTSGATLWQIGNTLKPVFSNDTIAMRGIMTDTLNTYPANANDYFTLKMDWLPNCVISIWHKYETDSLHAGGIVEFSTDSGATWINIADCGGIPTENFYTEGDTIVSGQPAFTGNSHGEQLSRFFFQNCFAVRTTATSCSIDDAHSMPIYFRFRFVSDATIDTLSGWIIDSIKIATTECSGGVHKVAAVNDNIDIYPNPATDQLTIQSANNINELTITNLLGQVMTSPRPSPKEREVLFVDVSGWPSGVYFVKVNGVVRKFVKE